jgi:hypothetical protein
VRVVSRVVCGVEMGVWGVGLCVGSKGCVVWGSCVGCGGVVWGMREEM